MIKKIIFYLVVILMASEFAKAPVISFIPLPNQYEKVNHTFVINERTKMIVRDSTFLSEAYYFKNQLLRYTGIPINSENGEGSFIVLQRRKISDIKEGAYLLNMNSDTAVISAADGNGIFNGIVSLLQLAIHSKRTGNILRIPCWNIQDSPLFTWRGLMLDESRHFFGKKVVKEILDQMALLKLNRFHWHLTDATGWRVEIQKYPKLTLIGGIGNYSDSLAPAKYYTQEDIREIVAYAKTRHIEVIPEIDMPGHATAANRAYPQYSGGGSGKYANFTFNPGKKGTYTFLTNILKEVSVLFPSRIIHLGGDEVSFGSKSWAEDSGVQRLMKQQSLKNLKEVEYYFFKRMTDSALQMFSKVFAWDEATDAGLPVNRTIIFWWRHDEPEQLLKALNKGYNVVLCPRIPLYFDFVQDRSDMDGRRWNGDFNPLVKVYDFSVDSLPAAKHHSQQILGIQADLWTETIQTKKRLEYMLFPRITALAEAVWTDEKNRNYEGYLRRLKEELPFFTQRNIYFFDPFSPNKTPEVVDE